MYYLLHFTGVLLTETRTSSHPEDVAVTNRSTNMSKRYDDGPVPRPRGYWDAGVAAAIRRKIEGLWAVSENVSTTHDNELVFDNKSCPKKLCNCNVKAMSARSYDSCMCTDNKTRCWFDGDGCFCKYDGRYCISASKGDHAKCPVKGVYAAVCQLKSNKTNTIEVQCLPSGTEHGCDVMTCRYMELMDDGSYRTVGDLPDGAYTYFI